MDSFPLQETLIEAVIGFVNDTLQSRDDVKKHFRNEWAPGLLPRLTECRSVQTEVRGWLLDARQGLTGHVLAVHGMGSTGYPSRSLVNRPSATGNRYMALGNSDEDNLDDGIQLTGQISLTPKSGDNAFDYQIVWDWKVSEASLRAICGLAVASICEKKLQAKVLECDSEACPNVFIDTKSRGKSRKYCFSKKCFDDRNNQSVKDSRKKNKEKKAKTEAKRTK